MLKSSDTLFMREVWRKLFHLSSLWMVFAIYYLGPYQSSIIFFTIMIGIFITECLSPRYAVVGQLYGRLFDKILRDAERPDNKKTKFSGAFYAVLAAYLAVVFFPPHLAMISLAVMFIADVFAALIGMKFGTIKIGCKSLQGSAAFFITSYMIITVGLFMSGQAAFGGAGLLATAIATLAELYSKSFKLDDNLTIVLATGLTLGLF